MKIAIIGTHSTGKTTLINKLAEKINNQGFKTAILFELSRKCPYPVNEKTSYKAQTWIQNQHLKQENNINHHDKILICDRATIDNFAYFEQAVPKKNIKNWEARAVDHMKSYDLVLKTRKLNIQAKNDGFRTTDEEFRTKIDEKIKKLIKKHKIKYYLLPKTTNYNIHLRKILKLIKKKLTCEVNERDNYILKQLKLPQIINIPRF